MASEALNVAYTASAGRVYNATKGGNDLAAQRYLIGNRGAGYCDFWCASDAAGATKIGSAIAVPPATLMLLVAPLTSGQVSIVAQGEGSNTGTCDIMPVNTPQ